MPAQPNEPASESLRNALQVLNAEEPYESRGQRWVEYAAEDVEAIRARLEAALAKLEAPRFARITQQDMGGAASEPPLDYERPGQVDPVLRGQPIETPDYNGE